MPGTVGTAAPVLVPVELLEFGEGTVAECADEVVGALVAEDAGCSEVVAHRGDVDGHRMGDLQVPVGEHPERGALQSRDLGHFG